MAVIVQVLEHPRQHTRGGVVSREYDADHVVGNLRIGELVHFGVLSPQQDLQQASTITLVALSSSLLYQPLQCLVQETSCLQASPESVSVKKLL